MRKERESAQYIKNTIKNKRLSHEEILELSRKWHKDKDKNALNKIIESNLLLVVKEASSCKKKNKFIELDDLIQAGNVGLIIASKMYSPERGLMFSTYAIFWIRAKIRQAIIKFYGLKNNTEVGLLWNKTLIDLDFGRISLLEDEEKYTEAKKVISDKWCKKLRTSAESLERNREILNHKMKDALVSVNVDGNEPASSSCKKMLHMGDTNPHAAYENAEKLKIKRQVIKEFCNSLATDKKTIFEDLFLNERSVKEISKRNNTTQQNIYLTRNRMKRDLKKAILQKPADLQEILKD